MEKPAPHEQPEIAVAVDNIERCLRKIEAQDVIFAQRPTRSKLLRLDLLQASKRTRLVVHRNHPFEYIANLIHPFASYVDCSVDIVIGDYDDSLTFSQTPDNCDAELIWLDYGRYRDRADPVQLVSWLAGRIATRRTMTAAPILVAADATGDAAAKIINRHLQEALDQLPGVRLAPQDQIARAIGPAYWRSNLLTSTGSKLSESANVETARRLVFDWLPIRFDQPVKAIAVDLDETLFRGILAEDGPSGIELTDGHKRLHKRLATLKKAGIFLILISQNERFDVDELFRVRRDLPLALDDFSHIYTGWDLKSTALQRAAADLKIGIETVLFIDDNSGHLAEVSAALPAISVLRAGPDGWQTADALDYFPGLFRWDIGETDLLRVADLKAQRQSKAKLSEAPADAGAYLAQLHTKIELAVDNPFDGERIHELSHKTNQFNLALKRFSEVEVYRRLKDDSCATVTLRLSDRLSDSGLVGVVWARRKADILVIDDLCLSCRALGRNLENAMISSMLAAAIEKLGGATIAFDFHHGPRNQPALQWLAALAESAPTELKGRLRLDDLSALAKLRAEGLGIDVEWVNAGTDG